VKESIPSSHNERAGRKVKALWQNIKVATYNIESTRGTRLHEVVIEAQNERVDILICQGTRSNYSGDGHLGAYKVYYEGHGTAGTELMTGICILIAKKLLTKGTLDKKWVPMNGRILMVRLKNQVMDITIVGAYAPGDHLTRELRSRFWRMLEQSMREIPKRSTKVMGIDANGHIGRDGMGGVGEAGQERWTNNGHDLERVINNNAMAALNTQNNCKSPGWTWQRRDGVGKGRIDYLVVEAKMMNRVWENTGATDLPKWGTQGADVDHRPVIARMGFLTLQEKGMKGEKEKGEGDLNYSSRNRLLTKAYETYRIMKDNEVRQEKIEVSQQDQDLVSRLQASIAKEMTDKWDASQTVDEMQQAIDEALKNAYDEILREKETRRQMKCKTYISDQTWQEIKVKNERWAEVRKWWSMTGIQGWEREINRSRQRIRQGMGYEQDFIRVMEESHGKSNGSLREGWQKWEEWDCQRRRVRQMVTKDKREHVKQIIAEVGQPEGPENIWKAIGRIAPRVQKTTLALGKEDGGVCLDVQEEITAIENYCKKHLAQETLENEDREEKNLGVIFVGSEVTKQEWDKQKPKKAEVREAFRHTHPSKATPEWSVPTKMYVVAEDVVAPPIQALWDKIGRDSTYPKSWQMQKTVWIPKPGKKKNEVHTRRGITILDGGAKGYLVWLQKRMARIMDHNNRRDEYGAVKKRGTAHALMKVMGIRNRMRKNKVCSLTFLGDAVKAFDKIDRRIVLERTSKRLGNEALWQRVVTRHEKMIARTTLKGGMVEMKIVKGVAQGDPNGPPMYVNGYEEVLENIESIRAEKGQKEITLQMPEWWKTKRMGGEPITLPTSKTMFVDDHLEVHKIELQHSKKHMKTNVERQVRAIVEPIFEAQQRVGVESGQEKTVVMLELHGKGSQKVMKELGGKITLADGRSIRIVENTKYLGARMGGKTEAGDKEIKERVTKANQAMIRLTQIWKTESIQLKDKVKLYKSLVTSLLLYATETRVWSNAQLAQMEALQMRHIRRIAKSPVHITLETNDELRERLGIASITSMIKQKRMRLWQSISVNGIEEIVATLMGKDVDEYNNLLKEEEDRMKLLLKDLAELIHTHQEDRMEFDTNEKGEIQMGVKTWEKIAKLNKAQLKQILTNVSEVEKRQKLTFGPKDKPKWACVECGKKFETEKGRMTHRVRAHNHRSEQRKLVQEVVNGDGKYKCLLCYKIYASKPGAQLHIDQHCAKKFTAEEIVNKLNRYGLL
jgi:exonuclease III